MCLYWGRRERRREIKRRGTEREREREMERRERNRGRKRTGKNRTNNMSKYMRSICVRLNAFIHFELLDITFKPYLLDHTKQICEFYAPYTLHIILIR